MKENKNSRLQVQKFDAQSSFVEVMMDALSIDRAAINFVSYDKSGQAGQRMLGSIKFYLTPTEAWALSQKIINGRMARARKKSVDDAAAAGSKYPKPIFSKMGGTNANHAKRKDGKAISRTFTIAPGSKYPWVLTAECGPGVAGPNGLLIVPDYGPGKTVSKPETIIRVPLSDESMEQFAGALDSCKKVWEMAKFLPLVQPAIAEKNEEWTKRAFSGAHAPSTISHEDIEDNFGDDSITLDMGDE